MFIDINNFKSSKILQHIFEYLNIKFSKNNNLMNKKSFSLKI